MIKASELRIGNFIFGQEEGYENTAMEICSLHGDNTFRLKIGGDSVGCYSSQRIKPIPLTEEWLIKLGFENRGTDKTYVAYYGNDLFVLEYWDDWHFSGGESVRFSVAIKYVHQLQNLFFSMTGEELTINQ